MVAFFGVDSFSIMSQLKTFGYLAITLHTGYYTEKFYLTFCFGVVIRKNSVNLSVEKSS